jgi:hypothetical protein
MRKKKNIKIKKYYFPAEYILNYTPHNKWPKKTYIYNIKYFFVRVSNK